MALPMVYLTRLLNERLPEPKLRERWKPPDPELATKEEVVQKADSELEQL